MKPATLPDPAARLNELAGPRARIVVAFSGGVDSTFLAHSLVGQRRKFSSIRLVHVDHRLHEASTQWSRHCARLARAWKVPYASLTATIPRDSGESPEAAAREARYALLEREMQPGEVLVTAQHRDDQVETLLLQLFRGAGVAGLAAMPAIAPFGSGRIARPLLEVPRSEIDAYVLRHRLRCIADPSNDDTRFGRNFLRHRVLPLVRENWPGVDLAIARVAAHMGEAARLLSAAARRDLAAAADGGALSVVSLRALPAPRRRNALRAFIARAGATAPSTAKLREMSGALLDARDDAQPEVIWEGGALRRRAGRLELHVKSQDAGVESGQIIPKSWRWKRERTCVLNAAGDTLALVNDPGGPIDLARLPETLNLRARSGGETLRPGERARTQSLKKLMQGAKLSLADRARLPLLCAGAAASSGVLAAGDRWIDASVAATVKSRRRGRLIWRKGKKGDRSILRSEK